VSVDVHPARGEDLARQVYVPVRFPRPRLDRPLLDSGDAIAVNRHVEATADLLRRIYDGGARQHQIVFH